jgi:hypothetical protein
MYTPLTALPLGLLTVHVLGLVGKGRRSRDRHDARDRAARPAGIADTTNSGGRDGGAIIAAPARAGEAPPYVTKRPTRFGVRTLVELAQSMVTR